MHSDGQFAEDAPVRRRWLLKRNCALAPRQLAMIYASLVAISTLVGLGFALCGAWLILPFVGVEMLAVGIALLHYGRHAVDRECVTLDALALNVEVVMAGRSTLVQFNPYWVRVTAEGRPGGTELAIWLVERQRRVAVGQFVGVVERAVFVQELKRALAVVQAGKA